MYKIKTLNKISDTGLDILRQQGYEVGEETDAPHGIMVRSAKMHDMPFNPELCAIARAGAGTNNIPIGKCTEEGIVVFNAPGANAEAVKELCICALILASRDVVGGIEWVRSIADCGDEVASMVEKGKSAFIGPEIGGKSLGVIGLGAVGAKIANTAISLGMTVYGYDPYLSVEAAWQLSRSVVHAVDVETIYANCDYITIHVPYMESTHHMIDADAIAKMRDNVRIINIARGELVDDEALIAGLDRGKVARYVTDFPNGRIAGLPNVVPMPHIGASTPESEEKCAVMAANELVDYLSNGNIKNSVNLPSVSLDRMGVARLCVIHLNKPGMINQFLDLISRKNINIEHMINKPRGEYAYTVIDTGAPITDDISQAISAMDEVMRVRVL